MSKFTDDMGKFEADVWDAVTALHRHIDDLGKYPIRDEQVAALRADLKNFKEALKTTNSIARDGVEKAQDVQHELRVVLRAELSKMYQDYRSGLDSHDTRITAIEQDHYTQVMGLFTRVGDVEHKLSGLNRTEIEDLSALSTGHSKDIRSLLDRIAGIEKREAARAEKTIADSIDSPKPAEKHVYLLEGMNGDRTDEVIGTYSTMLDAMEFVAWWNGNKLLGTLGTAEVSWGWLADEDSRQWINGRWRITELAHNPKLPDGNHGN